jgi:uncharacterized protein YndB with AHSA1/START domain
MGCRGAQLKADVGCDWMGGRAVEKTRTLQDLVGQRIAVRGPGADGPDTYAHGRVTEVVAGNPPVLVIDAGGTPPKVFWVPFSAPLCLCVDP